MSIDARAEGGAYHRVMVNGVEFSKHTTDYKAGEAAYDVGVEALRLIQNGQLDQFPTIYVVSDRRVFYEPDPNATTITIPPGSGGSGPISDAGEDLIDFWDRVDGEDVMNEPIQSTTFEEGIQVFAESTKGNWLVTKLREIVTDETGHKTYPWIGSGWRGYVLIFKWRDRWAIRIGAKP